VRWFYKSAIPLFFSNTGLKESAHRPGPLEVHQCCSVFIVLQCVAVSARETLPHVCHVNRVLQYASK